MPWWDDTSFLSMCGINITAVRGWRLYGRTQSPFGVSGQRYYFVFDLVLYYTLIIAGLDCLKYFFPSEWGGQLVTSLGDTRDIPKTCFLRPSFMTSASGHPYSLPVEDSHASTSKSQGGFIASTFSPVTSLYSRFAQWRASLGLPNPGQVEDIQKEVKSAPFPILDKPSAHFSLCSDPSHSADFRRRPRRPHQSSFHETRLPSHPFLLISIPNTPPIIQLWCCICNR
jgi:hypothetical protein